MPIVIRESKRYSSIDMRSIIFLCTIFGAFSFEMRARNLLFVQTKQAKQLNAVATPFRNLFATSANKMETKTSVENFLEKLNESDVEQAMLMVDDNIEFEDTEFPSAFVGKAELERNLRLLSECATDRRVVDYVASDISNSKIGVSFHMEGSSGKAGKKGNACFDIEKETGLIKKVFLVKESNKSGEANLKVLKTASDIIQATKFGSDDNAPISESAKVAEIMTENFVKLTPESSLSLPEKYFEAWNRRDMTKACAVFAEDIEYDDTAFPKPFTGKDALEKHLNICAQVFPDGFKFVTDDKISDGGKFMLKWHVENDGEELPFTRGCSYYELKNKKISRAIDVIEPAVFKTGGIDLSVKSIQAKITEEPFRLVPLALWFTYMYVVFFSDWFFGAPATALEFRTWEEVRDLSLNFFLVSPILDLPFAPVVHPMLEGVFNLLLSWAALFAGFLSDERRDKPNLLPMLPMVAGMQFLTSAFLLPYLVTRSNEMKGPIYREDLPVVAQVTENKLLPVILSAVGTGSIFWGIFARMEDFGGWNERVASFLALLSIDRVGSSFLVDLAIFALFQGWLVDDDMKRRGMPTESVLATLAKFVPFFGMAAYLALRSPLESREEAL